MRKGYRSDLLSGQTFGYWFVLSRHHELTKERGSRYLCKCHCGTEKAVRARDLLNGRSSSCGCMTNALQTVKRTKHGFAKEGAVNPLYTTWNSMMHRCYDKRDPGYKQYGGRGIYVCKRWHNVTLFVQDNEGLKKPGLSINRINNDGPYSPQNTTWSTRKEQQNNRSNHWLITHKGQTMNVSQWSEHLGVRMGLLHGRLKAGWPAEKAFATPIDKTRWPNRMKKLRHQP